MAHLSLLILVLVATMRDIIGSGEVHAGFSDFSAPTPLPTDENDRTLQADYEYEDISSADEETNTIEDTELEDLTTTPVSISETTTPTTTTTTISIPTTFEDVLKALSITIRDQNQYYTNFVDFELKSKSYMANMKSNLLSVLSSYSNSFHREVQKYIMQSPANKTIEITKHSREICDCDGVRMSPCPLKCLYSCYGSSDNGDTEYYEDCRYKDFERCECYKISFPRFHIPYCDRDKSLESCYTCTTETIPGDTECLEHRIDDKNVSKSFEAISAVLVEPIKKHFRGIETEVHYLRETAVSLDHSTTLVSQMCSPSLMSEEEPTCVEAVDALRLQINMYRQIKSNITRELLDTQKKIRDVYKSFKTLKEQHFTHISESFEKYACCLKASNFNIPNFNCTAVDPVLNKRTCQGQFTCESGECIPYDYLCDGGRDCPGGEDETFRHCRNYRG